VLHRSISKVLERQKMANQRSFRKRVAGRVVLELEISGKFSDFPENSFANSDNEGKHGLTRVLFTF